MAELIPIVMFTVIGVVFSLLIYFRYKARREIQETIRTAIQSGQTFDPQMLEELSGTLTNKNGDLRKGVIAIAIGVGVLLFGNLVGEQDARAPLLALSMFPLLIGVAYCGLWWYGKRQSA